MVNEMDTQLSVVFPVEAGYRLHLLSISYSKSKSKSQCGADWMSKHFK